MLLPRARADRKEEDRECEGIISRLTEVPSSNIFGAAILNPSSPYKNLAFPNLLKSWKFEVESCYG